MQRRCTLPVAKGARPTRVRRVGAGLAVATQRAVAVYADASASATPAVVVLVPPALADADPDAEIADFAFAQQAAFIAFGAQILEFELDKDPKAKPEPRRVFKYAKDEVNELVLSADGRLLLACDDEGQVFAVDIAAGKLSKVLARGGHSNIARSCCFRGARTSEIWSGGMDCKLIQWDARKALKRVELDMNDRYRVSDGTHIGNPPTVNALAVSASGGMIAAGLGDGSVCVLKFLADGNVERVVDLVGKHTWSVTALSFAESDTVLYSAGLDGKLVRWALPASGADADAEASAELVKTELRIDTLCVVADGAVVVGGVHPTGGNDLAVYSC